jgi:hypothetical protein
LAFHGVVLEPSFHEARRIADPEAVLGDMELAPLFSVAQTFLSAVSPTFLSAGLAKERGDAGWKAQRYGRQECQACLCYRMPPNTYQFILPAPTGFDLVRFAFHWSEHNRILLHDQIPVISRLFVYVQIYSAARLAPSRSFELSHPSASFHGN